VERNQIIKIVVVGPESTGKSTIAAQLADHYQTVWVPEYSREYCSKLNRECTLQDELNIFHGQLALEDQSMAFANKLLICDITILAVKVWCDYVFKSTPAVVLDQLQRRHYDFYLLMDIDLPWQPDPLRDFPDQRAYFMQVWENELKQLQANYQIIRGLNGQRFKNAMNAVNNFLKQI